jgi:hypothetical protein
MRSVLVNADAAEVIDRVDVWMPDAALAQPLEQSAVLAPVERRVLERVVTGVVKRATPTLACR